MFHGIYTHLILTLMCFRLSCIVLPISMVNELIHYVLLLCRSRTAMISGLPTKVGENMGNFLFEVLVTPRNVYLGRFLIPVEAALKYFPSLANHQETYEEKIEIRHSKQRLAYDTEIS